MKKIILFVSMAIAILGVSASSFACNSNETLEALDLASEVAANPSLCNYPMDSLGFDYGALLGAAARITRYFAQQGCKVDRFYLQNRISPSTQVCQIQRYVRFQ